ncbi:unnamed protein product [Rotaria sordida]|uniref:Uncharacterized protein n=1 Tax=Rotaria sordida TaxID=392033 RepID=A0A814EDJ2_9BILA|nr:unnamed protein product [Rotaria sordida]
MISTIIIIFTLLINASAIINIKLKRKEVGFIVENPSVGLGLSSKSIPPHEQFNCDKVREFLISLQYFRIFIGLWNILIIFAMFTIFSY